MNLNTPTVKTVRVLLLNLDERQFAIFRMAFKMHNATRYQLVQPEEAPELVLVDGDAADGLATWQQAKGRFPQARVVYFSTRPPTCTAPYLAKPIKFDTLFVNLRNLMLGNGVWVAGMSETATQTETAEIQPGRTAEPRQESVAIRCFSTEGTLLGAVQQLIESGQDTAVAINGKPLLIIFPELQKVLLAVDAEKIQALCTQSQIRLETKILPPGGQLHEKAKIKTTAFVWQLAIWTAQGRLIEPITPDTVLRLKAWPNMTRMAFLPEAMRLSAFLIKTPASLSMLYKLLPLRMEDILNFIAACQAIGYLHLEPSALAASPCTTETVLSRAVTPPASTNEDDMELQETSSSQPRGLLQRLMGRLLGK